MNAKRRKRVVDIISFAFRDGVWTPSEMAGRAAHDLAVPAQSWLETLAGVVVAAFPEPPSPRVALFRIAIESAVVESLPRMDHDLVDWLANGQNAIESRWPAPGIGSMASAMQTRRWPVVELETPQDVAEFLGLDPRYLEWFADVRSLERTVPDEDLRHYNYHWRTKRRGGARLVEAPKQNLKYLQRRLLRSILDHVPPHDAAHGFRAGRSIQSFAAPHTGRRLVVRMDLRSFFTSVPVGRVFATYEAMGYPAAVAHVLTGLSTNATPEPVLHGAPGARIDPSTAAMLRGPHLPQGAPTSPALANLAAFGLDVRLRALARRFDATYTRYADDLAVSGDDEFAAGARRFVALATEIVRDEGFAVHRRKTRMQRAHQRQVLTGMTVNRHLNMERAELDRLRAQLHEAVHHGPAVANRRGHPNYRAHLEGRIGHVQATNSVRARKLWAMFDQISW